MKKLMSIVTCMFFVLLLTALPCFSEEQDTPQTAMDEASPQTTDQTDDTVSAGAEETTPQTAEETTAPEPTTEVATETQSEITITDAAICRDVVDREPVGAGDVFSSGLQKVMCFTRVVGAKQETEILHNWYLAEKMMASVALRVGSDNWRTYSSKALVPEYAGEWKVEILSQDGELLKKIYFILE